MKPLYYIHPLFYITSNTAEWLLHLPLAHINTHSSAQPFNLPSHILMPNNHHLLSFNSTTSPSSFTTSIQPGHHHQNAPPATSIGTASKTYNVHSLTNKYPSYPIRYSTTLKILLPSINALVIYIIFIVVLQLFFAFPSSSRDFDDGDRRMRRCQMIAVTKNREKEMICTKRPITIKAFPIFWVLGRNVRDAEFPCIMNDNQSPRRKAFVRCLIGIGEWWVALRDVMRRESVM